MFVPPPNPQNTESLCVLQVEYSSVWKCRCADRCALLVACSGIVDLGPRGAANLTHGGAILTCLAAQIFEFRSFPLILLEAASTLAAFGRARRRTLTISVIASVCRNEHERGLVWFAANCRWLYVWLFCHKTMGTSSKQCLLQFR